MNARTRNLAIAAALAAAGVAVDRLSGPPEEAAAAAVPAVPAAVAPTTPAGGPAAAGGPAPALPPRSARLDARLLRDGADPAAGTPANPFASTAPVKEGPRLGSLPSAVDVRGFLARRPLEAVLGRGPSARAVVGGEVLRPGDVRDGMTLVEVLGRRVVWSGGGVRFAAGLRAAGGAQRSPVGDDGGDPVAALFDR